MAESQSVPTCPNCGALLQGEYCYDCGQQDLDLDRPFFSLMGEWLGNLFAFDARLWRTLGPLMVRPGLLTVEYLAGHRARYVPPLRLYFFASVAMFLALAWSGYSIVHETPGQRNSMVAVTVNTGTDEVGTPEAGDGETDTPTAGDDHPGTDELSWLESKIESLSGQPPEIVNALYRARLAQTLILLALAFAVFTRVLFGRPHRRLFHHLIFSMHVHAAAFAGIVLTRALGAALDPLGARATGVLGLVFVVYLLAYVFKALRLVHQRSRWSTAWRYLLLGAVYTVTLSLTLVSTLLLTAAFL